MKKKKLQKENKSLKRSYNIVVDAHVELGERLMQENIELSEKYVKLEAMVKETLFKTYVRKNENTCSCE